MPDGAEALFNPFPGLRSFESDETHLFFGRDGQSDDLLRILSRHRFVAVVGTSGSGKSSLVRAGVLPALQSGFMAGAGSSWRIATMRPGANPIDNLATSLNNSAVAGPSELDFNDRYILLDSVLRRNSFGLIEAARITKTAPRENLLVLVDQFEEIFRLRFDPASGTVAEEEDAAGLVRLLLEASRQVEVPIYVAITMRSDFLGDCAQFQNLPETMNQAQYLIPRMTREQRRQAIEGPVAVGGAVIAPRLVQKLLNDVGDAPDQLPILQHALMRTWDAWYREGKLEEPIDLAHYESIGGIANALSRHADEAYNELDARGQKIAQRMFETISRLGPDNREVRRPTRLSEICEVAEADEASVVRVIDFFRTSGRTFLVPPADEKLQPDSIIDISHEALIRLWTRLRNWTIAEGESAATYKRLADDAARHAAGRASLLREPGLTFALEWREKRRPNEAWARRYAPGFVASMDFLEKSRRAHNLAKWTRRIGAASGFVFAIVFLFLAITAAQGRREAQLLRTLASARQLIADAQSLERDSPEKLNVSTLLAIESAKRAPLWENDAFLRRAGGLLHPDTFRLKFSDPVSAVSFNPSSQMLVVAAGSIVAVADVNRGVEILRFTHEATIYSVVFSPDGSLIAAGGADGSALILSTSGTKTISKLREDGAVLAVAFDPTGKLVATGSSDQTARVFEASTGHELWRASQGGAVVSVAFSQDGRFVAMGSQDAVAKVFDAQTGYQVAELPQDAAVFKVVFSLDSRFVATGSADGSARVFEATTGKEVWRAFHGGSVYDVAFSPDGRYVASASVDNTARVFRAANGEEVSKLVHADSVNAVAFDPESRYLATASKDKTARLFEAKTGREVARLTHRDVVQTVTFSRDGAHLATGTVDGVAGVFDLATTGEVTLHARNPAAEVVAGADGRIVVAASNKTVELFDRSSGKELSNLTLDGKVEALAISADGKYLATGDRDNMARIFDIVTGKELAHLHHDSIVDAVAFSPDGQYLSTGSHDQSARVFEIATGKLISQLKEDSIVDAVAFSPDGHKVTTGSYDNTARVFDAGDGKERWRVKHGDAVNVVAFSPNGNYVASGGQDKTARLIETATGKQLWLQENNGPVTSLAFTSDSGQLLTGSSGKPDKVLRVFDIADGKEVARSLSELPIASIMLEKGDSRFVLISNNPDSPEVSVRSQPLDTQELIAEACAKLPRNLTHDEWKRYLQGEPYRTTCPSLREGGDPAGHTTTSPAS